MAEQLQLPLDPKTFGPRFSPGVLYIDSRVGSRELAPIFQRRHGAKTSLLTLESADVAFGCGHTVKNPFCPGDMSCRIGIERKTLSDLIGSLLKSRLDSRQVPLMLKGYTMSYILIEGMWRPGNDDAIEVYQRGQWEMSRHGLTYSQLEGWLTRYEVGAYGRIQVRQTSTMTASAAFIAAKMQWWRKDWNKHHFGQMSKMDAMAMPAPIRALTFQPNEYMRAMIGFPGIGTTNVKRFFKYFDSVIGMVMASPKELERAGLKKKVAADLYQMIRRTWR